ncbi:MAG: hypothetical protein Q8Q20_02755 [bacterium]|nr:hypothetical protein [bacterium]
MLQIAAGEPRAVSSADADIRLPLGIIVAQLLLTGFDCAIKVVVYGIHSFLPMNQKTFLIEESRLRQASSSSPNHSGWMKHLIPT